MILKILLLVINIFISTKSIENMTCKDVIIYDSPVTSIYDVIYNNETKQYENKTFDNEYTFYKDSLKTYFKNVKKYCSII